jgi:transaldolase
MHELAKLGQSVWLDYILRSFTESGGLAKLVEQGLRGETSNPTIFDNAISKSSDYDEDLRKLARAGASVDEIYESLAIEDIRQACDVFAPVYEQSEAADGYVSLEVNPTLAHEAERTLSEAKRLFAAVERPNLMIKIPGTPQGIPAIEAAIGLGVNVNVTLLFSLEQYQASALAYIAGLEKFIASGGDPKRMASVASFFVSRVDTYVDKELEKIGNSELQGKTANANAKAAYARFKEIFAGERWQKLAGRGARVQRPLWASTGTKNPAYSDVLYVDNLIGPHTVNTLPPATLEAFMDHGRVALTIEEDLDQAHAQLKRLGEVGVDLDAVTQRLLDDGVAAFASSFESLMASIRKKRQML